MSSTVPTQVFGLDLGRYECTSGGSNKFWECLYTDNGTFLTRWGPIGAKKASKKPGLSDWQAREKIREKLAKGYIHIRGSATSLEEESARRLAVALDEVVAAAPVQPRRRM
jgi:hypothetical protein